MYIMKISYQGMAITMFSNGGSEANNVTAETFINFCDLTHLKLLDQSKYNSLSEILLTKLS